MFLLFCVSAVGWATVLVAVRLSFRYPFRFRDLFWFLFGFRLILVWFYFPFLVLFLFRLRFRFMLPLKFRFKFCFGFGYGFEPGLGFGSGFGFGFRIGFDFGFGSDQDVGFRCILKRWYCSGHASGTLCRAIKLCRSVTNETHFQAHAYYQPPPYLNNNTHKSRFYRGRSDAARLPLFCAYNTTHTHSALLLWSCCCHLPFLSCCFWV